MPLKVKAIQWLIDLCYQKQPNKYKPNFLILKVLGEVPTINDCKPNASIIGVFEKEISYIVHAYSEPGGSLGIQTFKLQTLSDVFLNTDFKTHYLNKYLLDR